MTRKILIPVDGSENSERAFQFYSSNLYKDGDHVILLHVQQAPHLSTFNLTEPMQLPTGEWKDKLAEAISKSDKLIAHYEILCEEKKCSKESQKSFGKAGEAICQMAKEKSVDMIVMGSRGLNTIRRTFVGSVSDYVLHHTHVPVTVVPPESSK